MVGKEEAPHLASSASLKRRDKCKKGLSAVGTPHDRSAAPRRIGNPWAQLPPPSLEIPFSQHMRGRYVLQPHGKQTCEIRADTMRSPRLEMRARNRGCPPSAFCTRLWMPSREPRRPCMRLQVDDSRGSRTASHALNRLLLAILDANTSTAFAQARNDRLPRCSPRIPWLGTLKLQSQPVQGHEPFAVGPKIESTKSCDLTC